MKKVFFVLHVFLCLACKAQFTTTPVITGLPIPVAFAIAPDGRFFVSCKGYDTLSPAVVKVYSASGIFINDLWDFSDTAETIDEKGVLGIALDPAFSSNHYVYVFYNHKIPAKIRVVRFTEAGGLGTNPFLVLDMPDPYVATYHTGGNIHFRPSDSTHIYISIGDKGVPANAQDSTKWGGKILRIGSDGSIPIDNPFYDDGNVLMGNDDRIWAMGLRNSFDFCFSTLNESMYASENGVSTYDELNYIVKGGNYGWPGCEGIAGTCAGFLPPLEIFGALVPALTGIIFYSSGVIPELTNHVLITDYNGSHMHDVVLGNAPYYDQFISRMVIPGTTFTKLTDIEQGLDGCVYVNEINAGKISKFCSLVGIDEIKTEAEFSVFPNPATNDITVSGITVFQMELFNGQGEKMIEVGKNIVNVSHLESGIYFVKINGFYWRKVIKN